MSDFKILSDKEHILMRPGMYIGSTSLEPINTFIDGKYQEVSYVPGLVKIINEIIDNSVDEAIRTNYEFANEIAVTVDNLEVTVTDNGRGIPQNPVETQDGSMIPTPVAAWTLAKAGSNFTDERATIGMNGVGSALTNFFSIRFSGVTCDGKNTIEVICANNADGVSSKKRKGGKRGTSVTFTPDFERFGVNEITHETRLLIKERLRALSIAFPHITFSFNGKKIRESFRAYARDYGENVIYDSTPISFFISPSESGFLHNTYVNGVHTKNGGSHVDYIVGKIVDEVIPLIKRRHKIVVAPARVRECITFVGFLKDFNNPKFDSQTKERLTNAGSEISSHIPSIDYDKIAKQILSCDAIIEPIIEAELAKKLAQEKREATKAAKKAAKARVAKHVKAAGGKGVETTLFLTEGDSAIGYLLTVRDPKRHGGYPLRGKVKSTWGLSPAEQLKNNEIFEISAILGLKHGEKAENLAYDNIAIMTDSDLDGIGSIYPLLLSFFYNWPELFEQGRVMFCKTPVMISSNGKQEIWSYSENEFNKYKSEGKFKKGSWKHRYIKGLGSLEQDEYSRIINDPIMDVIKDDKGNGKDLFQMLFGDDSQLRKDWLTNEKL